MTYPLTFYKDEYVPEGSAACQRGPFIFIREHYRNDKGLYEHELTHIFQYWTLGLVTVIFVSLFYAPLAPLGMLAHPLLYYFYPRYRLACEVHAYGVQLEQNVKDGRKDYTNLYSEFIAEHYNLEVDAEEAKKMLLK